MSIFSAVFADPVHVHNKVPLRGNKVMFYFTVLLWEQQEAEILKAAAAIILAVV